LTNEQPRAGGGPHAAPRGVGPASEGARGPTRASCLVVAENALVQTRITLQHETDAALPRRRRDSVTSSALGNDMRMP